MATNSNKNANAGLTGKKVTVILPRDPQIEGESRTGILLGQRSQYSCADRCTC